MADERMFNSNRHRHRHGGKRIPNFVRPEERLERRRRPMVWFGLVHDLFERRLAAGASGDKP